MRGLGILLVGALLGVAFVQLLDAGAKVDDPRVLRIDGARPAGAPGGAAPQAIRPSRACLLRGASCVRDFIVPFEPPPVDAGTLALYIPQYTGNLQVSLNGTPVADSTHLQSAVHIGQGAPLLVPLPRWLLEPGGNQLELRVTRLGYGGFVGPLYIGADERLRASYDLARAVLVILPRLVDGMLLAIGLVLLLVWCMRRNDTLYLVCSTMSLCLAVSSLSSVAAGTLGDHALTVVNLLRFVAASLALPFAWLFVRRRPPVPIAWFLALPVCVCACILLLPGGLGAWTTWHVFVPVVLLLTLGAVAVFARAAFVDHDPGALLMFAAMTAAFLTVGRDMLVNAGLLGQGYLVMGRFNGPLMVAMMGTIVLSRLVAGLSVLERFNARLRHDVDAAAARLREAFDRERAHERHATLQSERMRLMGDLHDGIAGQLVSIISLSEQGGEGVRAEIVEASNRALTDLRLVVDSMEDVGDDLGMTLVAFRDRLEPQLRRCGVRLDWQVRALPDLPGLYPSATLAIFRLLQEAVNNAMRHSGSAIVEVTSGKSPAPGHGARLVVRDFGRGGAAHRDGGHGMDNMRRRAAFLGATLAVEDADPGTRVVVDLPARLEPVADATS
ncbi:MAG TPA: 7TM diverse intracellular signaling domain-containing protein [Xanthomonadaceae bacterium]|nr:7TM diverse intracellular signaling domain-containing protein [Xanthomonadaceae bacterium]